MRFPSSSMVLILKSMPMVVMKEGVQASSQKRSSRHDFPTPVKIRYFSIVFNVTPEILFTRIANEQKLNKVINDRGTGNSLGTLLTLIKKS